MFCLILSIRRRPPAHLRSFARVGAVALLFTAPLVAGGAPPTRADADSMLRKVAVIATTGLSERPAARRTPMTEAEVNSFLTVHAKSEMPAGVLDPVVVIEPSGRLTGRATVDLDQVREAQKSEGMSMLSLLSGRVPVEAVGVLHSGDGRAQFDLQSATANGIPIPKTLLQEVVAYYSRSAENPAGIDLDAPFELPARIREIQTEKGQAIVVQ
jgi:hypothetical protein